MGLDLFSQIKYEFGTGLGIVTPVLNCILKIFYFIF